MRIALVSNVEPFGSMFEEMKESIDHRLNADFMRLEEHIRTLNPTLRLPDEEISKRSFYQTLHKHPKFVRK